MNDAITNIANFRRRLATSQARDTLHSLLRQTRWEQTERQAAFDLACEAHGLDEAQARDLADWIEADQTIAFAKIA